MSGDQEENTYLKMPSPSGANVIDVFQSGVKGCMKKVGRDYASIRQLSSASRNITLEDHVTARYAAGEQESAHAKRATSPAGSTREEGPPNTPKNENDAAGAGAENDVAEHATRLDALLSGLPNLEIAGQCPSPVDEHSEKGDALSDTEHSTNPASPTTPPYEYGDTDEEDEFVVGSGMQML